SSTSGREVMPPAVPPAFAIVGPTNDVGDRALCTAFTGGSRAGSPAARGWCSVDFVRPGFQPRPGLSAGPTVGECVPLDALHMVGDTGLEPVTSCMSSKC